MIRIFSEGPAVSLKGSPTVSPITAALWASNLAAVVTLFNIFLALSASAWVSHHTAKINPETVAPASKPTTPLTPKQTNDDRGQNRGSAGKIISF